jgi:hypothetical protein
MFPKRWRWVQGPVGPQGLRSRQRRFRPEVLPLEERAVPSVTLVNETEVNDTPAQAMALPAWNNYVITSGAIQARNDVDYFSLTIPAKGEFWAFVDTGGPQDPASTSRSAKLTLFAPDGHTVLEQDSTDGTGTFVDQVYFHTPLIAGVPLGPGTYLLKLESLAANQIISPYKLYLNVHNSSFTLSETEPDNNSDFKADPIGWPKPGSLFGSVKSGDVDYYVVNARAGDVLFVAADADTDRTAATGTDLAIDLLTSAGLPLIHADSTGNTVFPPEYPAEGFAYTVPATDRYYLKVTGFNLTARKYELMVSGSNEHGAFQFGAPSYTAEEGGAVVLTVNRVAGSAGAVSVRYTVTGGTATPGSDFTPLTGTLTFADGETRKTVTIPVTRDKVFESLENFAVTLSNPTGGATVNAGGTAVVTITDVAPPLTDVTSLFAVTRGRVRFNPVTGRFRQRVTLRNISGQELQGPLWLVLDGLPRKVRLRNAAGQCLAHGTPGSPFAAANPSATGLAPGAGFSLLLDFVNPRLRKIRYTPLVLQGIGLI